MTVNAQLSQDAWGKEGFPVEAVPYKEEAQLQESRGKDQDQREWGDMSKDSCMADKPDKDGKPHLVRWQTGYKEFIFWVLLLLPLPCQSRN